MKKRSYIDGLPVELVLKIASYLEEEDQLSLLKASKEVKKQYPAIVTSYKHSSERNRPRGSYYHIKYGLKEHIEAFDEYRHSNFFLRTFGNCSGYGAINLGLFLIACSFILPAGGSSLLCTAIGSGLTLFAGNERRKADEIDENESIKLHVLYNQLK